MLVRYNAATKQVRSSISRAPQPSQGALGQLFVLESASQVVISLPNRCCMPESRVQVDLCCVKQTQGSRILPKSDVETMDHVSSEAREVKLMAVDQCLDAAQPDTVGGRVQVFLCHLAEVEFKGNHTRPRFF